MTYTKPQHDLYVMNNINVRTMPYTQYTPTPVQCGNVQNELKDTHTHIIIVIVLDNDSIDNRE